MLAAQLRADPGVYPDAQDYRRLEAAGTLIAPQTVARFYRWLLTDVPASEYSAHSWNVRDEAHHPRWLGTDDLYAHSEPPYQ